MKHHYGTVRRGDGQSVRISVNGSFFVFPLFKKQIELMLYRVFNGLKIGFASRLFFFSFFLFLPEGIPSFYFHQKIFARLYKNGDVLSTSRNYF